jgi:hypothetical protein
MFFVLYDLIKAKSPAGRGTMNTDLPEDENQVRPLAFGKAFRYLLKDAVKDFNAALELGRKRRDNIISRDEFSAEIARRFPPSIDAKP